MRSSRKEKGRGRACDSDGNVKLFVTMFANAGTNPDANIDKCTYCRLHDTTSIAKIPIYTPWCRRHWFTAIFRSGKECSSFRSKFSRGQ